MAGWSPSRVTWTIRKTTSGPAHPEREKRPWGLARAVRRVLHSGSLALTVYILQNAVRRFYVGQTEDLERRLRDHDAEIPVKSKFTHKNGPCTLAWHEEFETRSAAMKRERFIKSRKSAVWIREHPLNGRASPAGHRDQPPGCRFESDSGEIDGLARKRGLVYVDGHAAPRAQPPALDVSRGCAVELRRVNGDRNASLREERNVKGEVAVTRCRQRVSAVMARRDAL